MAFERSDLRRHVRTRRGFEGNENEEGLASLSVTSQPTQSFIGTHKICSSSFELARSLMEVTEGSASDSVGLLSQEPIEVDRLAVEAGWCSSPETTKGKFQILQRL